MLHRRAGLAASCISACLLLLGTVSAQDGRDVKPPPILYAVPHLELRDIGGDSQFEGGIDAALAIPLTWRTSITAGHYFNFSGDGTSTALLNFDRLLGPSTLLRGSAGLIDDDFGYGITAHRRMEAFGVGAFVHVVDGNWVGGLSLTRAIDWGVKLSRTGTFQGVGGVGEQGAAVALTVRDIENRGYSISTTPAYFPAYARDAAAPGTGPEPTQTIDATQKPTDEQTVAKLPSQPPQPEVTLPTPVALPQGLSFGPAAHLAWRYDAAGAVRADTPIADGVAFVGGLDGSLHALEARSGNQLWSHPAGSPVVAGPAVRRGKVYFGTQAGQVLCLPVAASGRAIPRKPLWTFAAGSPVASTPLLTDKGLVFFGCEDGTMYALDAAAGELMWSQQISSATLTRGTWGPYAVSQASKNGQAGSMPGAIIVGATNGRLYAVDEQTGALAWALHTGAPITGAAAVIGSTAYTCNSGGRLFALSIADGRVLWERNVGAEVIADVVAAGQMLLVVGTDGQVQAYAVDDGRRFWRRAMSGPVSIAPAVVDDTIAYVASDDGIVRALALDTGREIWSHNAGQAPASRPAIADGAMLIGGREIGLYGYRSGEGENIRVASLPGRTHTTAPRQQPPDVTPPVVTEGPNTPTWQNWGPTQKPIDTAPGAETAPPTVAQAPTSPVEGGASSGIQPPAPSAPPSADPRTTPTERSLPGTPPGDAATSHPDFPRPTGGGFQREDATPVDTRPTDVTPPVDTNRPTDVTPPTGPTPGGSGPVAVSMPEPDDDPLHMTVLTDAVAGDTPLLVTNRNYAYVGGTIGDPTMVARIEVNGTAAAMEGSKFLHKETFDGPGLYTMRVVAISPHGVTSERTRRVRVIAPSDPQVRESFVVQGTPVQGSRYLSFTVGMGGRIHGEMLVMEVQTAEGAVVQRWTHPGSGPTVVNWDGHNMSSEAVLPGEYMGVFALMLGDQLLARIRQPIRIEY